MTDSQSSPLPQDESKLPPKPAPGVPHAVQQYVFFQRILALVSLFTGFVFFFFPGEFFYLLNVGPKVFRTFMDIPIPTDRFWSTFASGMMVSLAASSWCASLDPRAKGHFFVSAVTLATSCAGFVFLFLQEKAYFAYLAGILVNAVVFLTSTVLFIRVLASREPSRQ